MSLARRGAPVPHTHDEVRAALAQGKGAPRLQDLAHLETEKQELQQALVETTGKVQR